MSHRSANGKEWSRKLVKSRIIVIALLVTITGCASTSDFDKRASHHAKTARYFESHGQKRLANIEYGKAREERRESNKALPVFFELFNIFNN